MGVLVSDDVAGMTARPEQVICGAVVGVPPECALNDAGDVLADVRVLTEKERGNPASRARPAVGGHTASIFCRVHLKKMIWVPQFDCAMGA